MAMHNPPHPSEFIKEIYITPFGLSVRKVAENLSVSPSTLTRLLNGRSIFRLRWPCACQRRWDAVRRAG